MDLLLGLVAFGGAVIFVAIVRSASIARAGWSRASATRLALGLPLATAIAAVVLALVSSRGDAAAGGGLAGLALPVFLLLGLAIGLFGVGLSKLVAGEWSTPRD